MRPDSREIAMPRKLKSLKNIGNVDRAVTHTIDGKAAKSANSFDVINPATDQPFARCPDASREQLDLAVAAARKAFPAWANLTFANRRRYLHKFADRVRDYAD